MQLLTKKLELTSRAFQCLRNLDFNLTKNGNVRMHLITYKGKGKESYDSIFQRNVIKLEYVDESYYIYVEPKNVIKVDKDLDSDVCM